MLASFLEKNYIVWLTIIPLKDGINLFLKFDNIINSIFPLQVEHEYLYFVQMYKYFLFTPNIHRMRHVLPRIIELGYVIILRFIN